MGLLRVLLVKVYFRDRIGRSTFSVSGGTKLRCTVKALGVLGKTTLTGDSESHVNCKAKR